MNLSDPKGNCIWDVCATEIAVTAIAVTAAYAYATNVLVPDYKDDGLINGSILQTRNTLESKGYVKPLGVGHPDSGVKGIHIHVGGIKGQKGDIEIGIKIGQSGEWELNGARPKDKRNESLGKAKTIAEKWLGTKSGLKELADKAKKTAAALKGRDETVKGKIDEIEDVAEKASRELDENEENKQ